MLRTLPKISCSLLAARERGFDLPTVVRELPSLGIDMIHFDISDDPQSLSLEDLRSLHPLTPLPFDIHLSAEDPWNYASGMDLAKKDFISLHVESDLDGGQLNHLRSRLGCHFGLALNTESSVERLFRHAPLLDFTLFMAARPGVSGGSFDDTVVDKIRTFRRELPNVPVHVDGGVNVTSAALLRDVGVDVMISGSYIFKSQDAIRQVTRLLGRNLHRHVGDIMRPTESSRLPPTASVQQVAETIQKARVGCACVVDDSHRLLGLITDGDLRRRLMTQPDLSRVRAAELMRMDPFTTTADRRLLDLLRELEASREGHAVIPVLGGDRLYQGLFYLQDLLLNERP